MFHNERCKYLLIFVSYFQQIIIFQMTKAEEAIKFLEKRIEDLEDELISKNVPEEKQKMIETELIEVRKTLNTNKEMLSKLHKDNMKSFSFVVILLCGCFTLYVIYILLGGLD